MSMMLQAFIGIVRGRKIANTNGGPSSNRNCRRSRKPVLPPCGFRLQTINETLLAYAFILTHQWYPCVFWQDYFNWNLAQPDNRNGIDALVKIHEQNAVGPTQILFADDDLCIMQCSSTGDQAGLILFLNNRGSCICIWVQTRWNNRRLIPAAWGGPR